MIAKPAKFIHNQVQYPMSSFSPSTFFKALIFAALASVQLPIATFGEDGADAPESVDTDLLLPLSEALQIGLQQNFGLQVQTLDPRIAREETTIAESTFDPRLSASVSWAESKSAQAASTLEGAAQPEDRDMNAEANVSKRFSPGTEVTAGTGVNRYETNSSNALLDPDYRSEFGVELRQPLLRDFGPKVNLAPVRSARAGFQQSQIEYEENLASFFEILVSAYWETAAAIRRLELSQSSVDLAQTILNRTQKEFDLGLATRSDILQSKAELATRMESRLGFEKEVSDRMDQLRFVLGENLTDTEEPFLTSPLPDPPEESQSISEILAEALNFDPTRRALEKERIRRENDLLVSTNTTRPDLDLVLGGDYQGREEEFGESYSRALDQDGYRWRAGIELSFPWGFAEQRARERQAMLRLRQTEIRIDEAEAQVRQAVRTAWRQLENGRAQLETARATVLLREEVLLAEEARRERGLADISDVLQAARLLDDARLREVDAVLATLLAHTRLGQLDGNIFAQNGYELLNLTGRTAGADSAQTTENDS